MKKRYKIKATCFDDRGKIISVGFNSYNKTHPVQAKFAEICGRGNKKFLHAEIDAIVKAKGRRIYRILVERYLKNGKAANARPCKICQRAISASNIKKVVYTT